MKNKLIIVVALAALLVVSANAATMGDPLDGNDRTMRSVEDACGMALQYPACNWCWTDCLFALLFDPGSGWDFDDY